MNSFIEKILTPSRRGKTNLFWDTFQKLLSQIMYFGCINSLSQTLLKLTSPGVPDIYQGEEMWNFNLVDPDNRRPVDFKLRSRAADELRSRSVMEATTDDLPRAAARLSRRTIKLWVTMRALNFRRDHSEFFRLGRYHPTGSHRAEKRSMSSPSRASTGEKFRLQLFHD